MSKTNHSRLKAILRKFPRLNKRNIISRISISMMKESTVLISSDVRRSRSDRGAFTLIELLVVIVILAVLAVLIFPVASRAVQSAKRAACASKLKQIGAGIALYRTENNLRLPTLSKGASYRQDSFWLWQAGPTYLGMLYPDYVKDYQSFYCPGQDNTNDWFLNRGTKRFQSGLWGRESILSTYVQRDTMSSPPIDDRLTTHAFAACCRHGSSLIPHGATGPNVLYLDGSVRWLAGNEDNNYRPWDQSTRNFWDAADAN